MRAIRPLSVLLALGLCTALAGASAATLPEVPDHGPATRSPGAIASQEAAGIWTPADAAEISRMRALAVSAGVPRRLFALDAARLETALARAPHENAPQAEVRPLVLALPLPDGSFARYAVWESSIFEPSLAARYPRIRTFRAQGLDDPTATARLDWTPDGFHGIVFTPTGTVYIDPPSHGDTAHSVAYYHRDSLSDGEPFRCLVPAGDAQGPGSPRALRVSAAEVLGTTLRTYRLAVAATGEWTQAHGGTVPDALSAIATVINRVDGIYEREVAIHFVIVAAENTIIYTDSASDPYTNGNAQTMDNENQSNLDATIQSANYDIGHVFGTAGGGFADAGVCTTGQKAKGATGTASSGDAFAVDYVAHEIGHQFGTLHTFNGTTGGCGNSNQRDAGSAYEPGSGSTIMAYAGVCGSENLQPHSDDYFHWKSLEEIEGYLAGVTCSTNSPTGNSGPTVVAGADYAIPAQTPFQLTATGTDPNGDALTFCWEEADLGAASPPNTDDGSRPIFRSFLPTPNRTRTFPRLSDLVAGAPFPLGESLPTTIRTMRFRVTARDNRSGGGSWNFDTAELDVRSDVGPFAVTQPDTALTWSGGSLQTVTWNVAGTDTAPVSCTRVRILLSIDGGLTFPYVLALNTRNDGSETVAVPSFTTSSARVKVQALANVFFDLSNEDFTLDAGQPLTLVSAGPTSGQASGGTALALTGTGFVTGATVRVGGVLASGVSVPSSTSATATAPPLQPGTLNDVLIRDPDATTATLSKSFFADFSDVPQSHLFHASIEKIFRAGITSGCGGGKYCPSDSVTRAQMAIFLLKGEHGPGYSPPAATGTVFSDVPAGAFGAAFIERLAAEGITSGCGGGKYCPNDPVTRDAMAKFLLKAEHGSAFVPPAPAGLFSDVPVSHPFAKWIEQLFYEGITFGCGGTLFCPGDPNTRGQMAAFLSKAFNLP